MSHDINPNIKNSDLNYCINEYVRNEQHREILRDKWFKGFTLEQLAEKYKLSVTRIKVIIYDIGDNILIKACEIHNEK